MKFKAKDIRGPIDEGKHKGKIVRIEYRDTPFEYTDIYMTINGTDSEVKYGCPSSVSVESKLGKLLMQVANVEIIPGHNYDPEALLVGKEVSFVTFNEKGKNTDREFARVSDGSIKPLK